MARGYGLRTLDSIEAQCAARGIPEDEVDDVVAHVEAEVGLDKELREMSEVELRRVNRELPALMESYLDGEKRRGDADRVGLWEDDDEDEG